MLTADFTAIMFVMKSILFTLVIILLVILTACSPAEGNDAPSVRAAEVTSIQNKGSDTIVNLALAWAESYQAENSDVSISVTGGGSGTGIAALINETVDIANASRSIKPEEIQTMQEKGIDPVEYVISRDAIAIIVNLSNPIEKLTLQQVSDIYSGKINNWSELGGEDRPIVRLSRETNSGTHVYFLEQVLRLGDKSDDTLFAQDTLLLPSSEGITSEVRDNPNAIGYDGLGYITDDEKVISIADIGSSEYIIPSIDTVNDGTYPIARDLYMYTTGAPSEAVLKYLEWIYSPEAQEIVRELGFVPIINP